MYGRSGDALSVIKSIKDMVKKLHANGIEVFLEVVFTHTAEDAPLMHVDNTSYCIKAGDLNIQNALNCNYPIVQQMILDCLRHWVIEFRIDGFVFINASSLLRGFHGEILSRPPLVEAIAFDPILSNVKIIADNWNPVANDSKENLFPHWRRWAQIKLEENIRWHGIDQSPPKWDDPSSKFLAMTLKADAEVSQTPVSDIGGDLFVAFNSAGDSEGYPSTTSNRHGMASSR
ncbi:hypothetical protein FXO38_31823 [Capsicum annuum]|uniref:Isoamylase 2, chloroplastic-like n=1 Tax=Capsicum annuum TaxID=4072 RepID=A0A2G2YT02_CAPAN|nr:hypothetical protein FXO38_31823 [Capsicum annuum]KAF3639562.1 hypothetical protein FXO37_23915 [Capsicum annuum]PHT72795.1 hypothetical protein T459_23580 [Capsicum annuum]